MGRSSRWKQAVTFEEGLKERFGDKNIKVVAGNVMTDYQDAIDAANRSDVVFVTLGLSQTWSGEATSLTSIRLPETQTILLEKLKATGKPIVALLVTARPLDLTYETQLVDAILLTWHPGTMAGKALAEVVSGDYNPSGKITMTFPRTLGQVPIHYNMKNTGRPVDALTSQSSDKYTSRYMFTSNEPLFPFGYGLSYTTLNIQI